MSVPVISTKKGVFFAEPFVSANSKKPKKVAVTDNAGWNAHYCRIKKVLKLLKYDRRQR
jgi:hypothetical protein